MVFAGIKKKGERAGKYNINQPSQSIIKFKAIVIVKF